MCTPFPFEDVQTDFEMIVFNKDFCAKRAVVEHSIGHLKNQFVVLSQGITLKDPEIWSKLIQGDFKSVCIISLLLKSIIYNLNDRNFYNS